MSAARRSHTSLVAATLLGAVLLAWIVLAQTDARHGRRPSDRPRSLGWFVGIWVAMTQPHPMQMEMH